MNDQDRISPHDHFIHTTSSKQVMRKKKISVTRLAADPTPNASNHYCDNCTPESMKNYKRVLEKGERLITNITAGWQPKKSTPFSANSSPRRLIAISRTWAWGWWRLKTSVVFESGMTCTEKSYHWVTSLFCHTHIHMYGIRLSTYQSEAEVKNKSFWKGYKVTAVF